MNTILQIPVNKNIRNQATLAAEKMGFSSLQEVVRLFLNKVAKGQIDIAFEPAVNLSSKNDRRYSKMIADLKLGKVKTKSFSDVSYLMEYLQGEN